MKKAILLVDDDADDRMLFEEIYAELGYNKEQLLQLENGQEVVDFIAEKNAETLPALIILDHNMPKMTGEQTLRYLKSNPQYSNIPVVIYSTSIFGQFAEDCKELGAVLVLEKPGLYRDYNEMIAKVMSLVQ
jgi:CheY-like chemotaxis protein